MYQKHLPLVYRNQWYFEDVHIWRYYGEIPIQLDPNSSEVQELEAIVDDGQEHLFDIVETNMLGTDGYGNGVAFRKIIQ
ncbi:MAG: hypothetical protein LBD75_00590 [Candidatus Peribacteria bacterium]|jgi:hypothetical protein|nr:hypothetical protein [Candidatus Peribacteria bacterium]